MKYICNLCAKVFQADDITIHYKTEDKRLEIVAICQPCLEKYLEKTKVNNYKKEDENERMNMKRKW